MIKKIFCKFLNILSEKQDYQLYPGSLGKKIFDNISKKAWNIWKKKQTILINENKLSTKNIYHLKFIEKKMINFLFYKNKIKIKNKNKK
ncbi:MAG: oxidative damage protection protein [Candidatus Makana argininalis]